MISQTVISLLLWAGVAAAAATGTKPGCFPITIPITATAQNSNYSAPPKPNNETDIVNYVHNVFDGTVIQATGIQNVSGTFNIKATYCRPAHPRPDGSEHVLQILVSGITYNKTMWSGLGMGDTYNYHKFANMNRYHTLAIDRLGHGENDHPDPFGTVQAALQIEIMHQLIALVKGPGTTSPFGRSYSNVTYVGHSYGSFLGLAHARFYPTDIDALVLTGFSTALNFTWASTLNLASAATLSPQRFPGVPLGYVTTASESQREAAFYAGLYDPAMAQLDFAYKDTVTDGEVAGLYFVLQPAIGYTNPVYIVTGAEDAIFCNQPPLSCDSILNSSRIFFPDSKRFDWLSVIETGHTLTLHQSAAPVTFTRIHLWLDKIFKGL